MFHGYSNNPSTKDCAHISRSGGTIGVTVHFISSMALQTKKEEFLSNNHNKQRFIAFLSQRLEQQGARSTKQEEKQTSSLCKQQQLSKKLFWLGTIQICVCSSSIMQRTSGVTSSSNLKLDGRVKREIDAGTSLQCDPFLEVLSLTTLCSCMPFMGVIPRLVFTVWARNYKSQRSNRIISCKIRQRFS